jgi:hypothetical protein
VGPWTSLLRSDPERLAIELAKLGITIDDLVQDGYDDPGPAPLLEKLQSEEAKRQAALEWFGDRQHPQPKERPRRVQWAHGRGRVFRYAAPTPDWGRLPPLADDEPPRKAELPKAKTPRARPLGSTNKWEGKPIPDETFWELFRLAVEEDASARGLEKLTDERADLEFVNRNKAGNIVKWVKSHRTLARRALDRHELPRLFRATPDGVFPPAL